MASQHTFCWDNPVNFIDIKGESIQGVAGLTLLLSAPLYLAFTKYQLDYGVSPAITIRPLNLFSLGIQTGKNFERLSMPAREVVLDHELMHHMFGASEKDAYKMQLFSARRMLVEGYAGRALNDTEITEVRDLEIGAKTTLEYLGDPNIPGWKKTSLYMLIAGSQGWL